MRVRVRARVRVRVRARARVRVSDPSGGSHLVRVRVRARVRASDPRGGSHRANWARELYGARGARVSPRARHARGRALSRNTWWPARLLLLPVVRLARGATARTVHACHGDIGEI